MASLARGCPASFLGALADCWRRSGFRQPKPCACCGRGVPFPHTPPGFLAPVHALALLVPTKILSLALLGAIYSDTDAVADLDIDSCRNMGRLSL